MHVIVVGCGRVGAELAYRLYQKGQEVVVIDEKASAFDNLPTDFRGRTVEGEALSEDVLRRAEIEQADGLAAVTNSDTVNAVVAHVARTAYQVPIVVVRNYDSRWATLHEVFGLQMVSSTAWGAQRIEELLYHADIRAVFSAGNGEVEVYEFAVPATWRGCSLVELLPPNPQYTAVALSRAGRAMLPSDDICLEVGDVVLLSATLEGIEAVRHRLHSLQEV